MNPTNAEIWVELPREPVDALTTLCDKGFSAFLVGGCVRDTLMGKKPKDWDIATNALPEEMLAIFPHAHYENAFGTVGVVYDAATDESLKIIEVTPFRAESEYSDGRRPNEVSFGVSIEKDLARRDFTINAIALAVGEGKDGKYKGHVLDPHGGIADMNLGTVRTVGDPLERFSEDGLRVFRALRLATELGFTINPETEKAIMGASHILAKISRERIRDEFSKMILADRAMDGMKLMRKLGIIPHVLPELAESFDVEQNQAHSYDVWEHLIRSLDHAAKRNMSLELRIAALLHDIGKPSTRRRGQNGEWTFYGHEVVGARISRRILEGLKFPVKTTEAVVSLVRWHMFFSDTEKITLSAVRRIITKVGKERIWDLMDLRACDRVGTGRPKENPYRFRKYKAMVEEALRAPLSVSMLAVNGSDVMRIADAPPGPKIGLILNALLEEVLEDPTKNTREHAEARIRHFLTLPEKDLLLLGNKGKERREEEELKEIQGIRGKYGVD